MLEYERRVRMGNMLVFPEKRQEWENYVKELTDSTYGRLVDDVLELMVAIELGKDMWVVYDIFKQQKHSAGSRIVEDMVLRFSKRGPEYIDYLILNAKQNNSEWNVTTVWETPEWYELVENTRQENIKLSGIKKM